MASLCEAKLPGSAEDAAHGQVGLGVHAAAPTRRAFSGADVRERDPTRTSAQRAGDGRVVARYRQTENIGHRFAISSRTSAWHGAHASHVMPRGLPSA